jgi:hypothetical protein
MIAVGAHRRVADVQGMCTYETLVDATLAHGLMPLGSPPGLGRAVPNQMVPVRLGPGGARIDSDWHIEQSRGFIGPRSSVTLSR